MDLMETYEIVYKRLIKLDFLKLWPGFHRFDFALYDDEKVILNGIEITKTDDFIANTAIMYQGRYIAIWKHQDDIDIDILISKIVHEMFHAFQYECNESRYADEFNAVINYQYDYENLLIKYEENKIISQMVFNFDIDLFNKFLSLRRYRKKKYPLAVNYESSIEVVEGTAQYIELLTLNQLDLCKYNERLNQSVKNILDKKKLFPIRIISYDIGALTLKICIDNRINIDQAIKKNTKTYLERLIAETPIINHQLLGDKELKQLVGENKTNIKSIIRDYLNNHKEIIKGNFELLAFNVYSAQYYEGYLYSKHFLMYNDGGEKQVINHSCLAKIDNTFSITAIYIQ